MRKILLLCFVSAFLSLSVKAQIEQTVNSTKNTNAVSELTYVNVPDSEIDDFGMAEYFEIKVANYFPDSIMANHNGEDLTKISAYFFQPSGIYSLKICVWDSFDFSTPLYEQIVSVANITEGWNDFELNTPYTIGTEGIMVGYDISGSGMVMGVENGTSTLAAGGVGDLFYWNGFLYHAATWYSTGDFAIKATVGSPDNLDIALQSIDVDAHILQGMTDVSGTVVNMGVDIITSYDVTYSINGGSESATYSVTDVNIVSGATAQFTHDVQADFSTADIYQLQMTISNVNGIGSETQMENNSLDKNIYSVSEVIQKKVLHELFTSATCAPCATSNPYVDDLISNNLDKATIIKYQSYGDPYYSDEAFERGYQFYGDISGIPHLKADAQSESVIVTNPEVYTQEKLNTYASLPSLFKIEGTANYENGSMNAEIDVTGLSSVSGNLFSFIAVVENTTTGNVATNGETEFHNVMMKFMDSTNGNVLEDFTAGNTQHISVSTDVSNTNIEEVSDVRLLVWVQDTATKEVYQSAYINLNANLSDLSVVNLNTVDSDCSLASDAQVKATVLNNGDVEVSSFELKCLINGNVEQTYSYSETLNSGSEVEIIFPNTFDFSQAGDYNVQVVVVSDNDVWAVNDTISKIISNISMNAEELSEDFSNNPDWWTVEDVNNDETTWAFLQSEADEPFGHNDLNCFAYNYSADNNADDYLYTRCLQFDATKTYNLDFWYRVRNVNNAEKLNVFIGTAPSKESMTQQIVDLGELDNIEYLQSSTEFSIPESGIYYIGFHVYSDANRWRLYLDDISISLSTSLSQKNQSEFIVYPNPTKGMLNIEDVQDAQIMVYNMIGEIVYQSKTNGNRAVIDLSNQTSGNYILKIIKNKAVSTQKIVLTK